MLIKLCVYTVAVALLAGASEAGATVVNFDDLPGAGFVPDGYAGITWNGQWRYLGVDPVDEGPYVPESPPNAVYTYFRRGDFKFSSPVVFDGAYFSGFPMARLAFQLLLGGATVARSNPLEPSGTPTFLSSSYGGPVDEVRVRVAGDWAGYYIMDNVTFNEGVPVGLPEPATWAMTLLGFGGLGAAMRQRRRVHAGWASPPG
jgi:hypothetical protein